MLPKCVQGMNEWSTHCCRNNFISYEGLMKCLTNHVGRTKENSWCNYYKSSHQEKRAVFLILQNNHNRATLMIRMCFTVQQISCFAAWLRGCTGSKVWSPTEGIKRLKAQEMDIYARVVSERVNRKPVHSFAGEDWKTGWDNPYNMSLYHRRRSSAGGTLII